MTNIISFPVRTPQAPLHGEDLISAVETTMIEQEKTPRYSDPGRILFEIIAKTPHGMYKYDVDVFDYDYDASPFWIAEVEGFRSFFGTILPEDLDPGVYVMTGIEADCMRGDGWETDDDIDWGYTLLRPATEREKLDQALPLSEYRFKSEYMREVRSIWMMSRGIEFSPEMNSLLDEARDLFGAPVTERLQKEAIDDLVVEMRERLKMLAQLSGYESETRQ